MDNLPAFLERLHAALHHSPVLFFFAVHFTLGRTFSLLAGLWVGLSPPALIGLAWVGDMMNIPFFVTLYELGHRGLRLSPTIALWLDRTRAHLERRRFYERFAAMGSLGVVAIAATPMWGCGMWSAILLAWTMRMKRLAGSLYLTVGSVAGSIIVLTLAAGAHAIYRMF
jgi:uncharacterized membrane protein